jgi:hypothetical protein
MITLLTTLLSFLAGGVPKLLGFFQDRSDKSHEMDMGKLQMERDLRMAEAGYLAQARVEEVRTDQIAMQTQAQERVAMYQHDIEIGKGASQWVVNARAMVRPFITYGMFGVFVFVEIAGFAYAWRHNVEFTEALKILWSDETITIWSSIIAFWFGTQAFSKK